MNGSLHIVNSNFADVDLTMELFYNAIQYQTKNGYELWPQFSRELIETEITEDRHFKIIDGTHIACVFSIMYSDPIIWGERDKDPAIYLHRIAVNTSFKGKGMMILIRKWALLNAIQKNKKYVRMDTWGNNENLRNYYISCGFTYIGQQHLERTEGLPGHYGGDDLSLFEIEV